MIEFEQLFHELGFSSNEAKVYLAALELGRGTVQEIAKASGVVRTTIYTLLPHLKEQGLIVESRKGKKIFLVATDPMHVEKMLTERKEKFSQALPELQSLFKAIPSRPIMRYYEGQTGIKQIYQDTLDIGKEIWCFTPWRSLTQAMPEYWNRYIGERVKRGVPVKALADRSQESVYYREKGAKELRELRFLPEGTPPFHTEINIYGDKVAMLSFKLHPFVGVLIENKDIADTWRIIFDMVWRQTKG